MKTTATYIVKPRPTLPSAALELDAKGYPVNWPEIALAVKAWAGWQCVPRSRDDKHCGHDHDPASGYTLTVHHLNGIKTDCDWRNLVALCQRCHLRIQATYIPGQLVMFDVPVWMVARELLAR